VTDVQIRLEVADMAVPLLGQQLHPILQVGYSEILHYLPSSVCEVGAWNLNGPILVKFKLLKLSLFGVYTDRCQNPSSKLN